MHAHTTLANIVDILTESLLDMWCHQDQDFTWVEFIVYGSLKPETTFVGVHEGLLNCN
jgi:hypothetical protein